MNSAIIRNLTLLLVFALAPAFELRAADHSVEGDAPAGEPIEGAPVLIGCEDPTGDAQPLQCSAGGQPAPVQTIESPANAACKKTTTAADVTVDATAGGVTVIAASSGRCCLLLQNSGAADMRCASASSGAPTASFGILILAGTAVELGPEGQEAYKCIRTGGTSTTATPTECLP